VSEQAPAPPPAAQGQNAEPVDVSARVERKQASGGFFQGFGAGRPRRRAPSALHTALMVAGGAAFLSVGAAGVVLMEGPDGAPPSQQAQLSPFGATPRAAVALAPGLASQPAPAAARLPDDDPQAKAALISAVAAISANRPGGLTDLKALSDRGYAPAQLRLAHLYETGEAGVVKNLAEARRLTTLAAEAGSAQAMHNLGVYFYRGDGGPKDLVTAAGWFRKAAAAGVTESQYNLGLMYQAGVGVQLDLSEARRWFDMAAAGGDRQAERAAEAVGAAITAGTPQLSVPQAKRILERLGYYDGPMDAGVSPDFRGALAQYQHDQGRTPTGDLDPGTAGLLSVYQR
jgi:localization factor PodJL